MIEFAPTGNGKAIIVSTYEQPFEIDLNMVMMKNLELVGFLSGLPGSYPLQSDPFKIAIELIRSGSVKVDSMVSAVMPLEKLDEAFTKLSKAEEMVILVEP